MQDATFSLPPASASLSSPPTEGPSVSALQAKPAATTTAPTTRSAIGARRPGGKVGDNNKFNCNSVQCTIISWIIILSSVQ